MEKDNRNNKTSHRRRGQIWRFRFPHEIVNDAGMGVLEKRALLAAWASDVHAVESFPTLRHLPGTPYPVTVSSILEALGQLDRASRPLMQAVKPWRDGAGREADASFKDAA